MAFCFPQQLSAFQEIQESLSNFPQRLSSFQELWENLSTAASIQKIHYSSFVFPATCSPSFVIPATMSTSHPTSTPWVCPSLWATLTPERKANWNCKGYNKLGLASRPHHGIATNHGYSKPGPIKAPLWVQSLKQSRTRQLLFVKAQV